jgi:hypothetical protein
MRIFGHYPTLASKSKHSIYGCASEREIAAAVGVTRETISRWTGAKTADAENADSTLSELIPQVFGNLL